MWFGFVFSNVDIEIEKDSVVRLGLWLVSGKDIIRRLVFKFLVFWFFLYRRGFFR